MIKKYTFNLLLLIISSNLFAQKLHIERYDNGNIKVSAFVKDEKFHGSYEVFYPNGKVKMRGQYDKDCKPELNGTMILSIDCVPKTRYGYCTQPIGIWETYFEDGSLETKNNYHCGIKDGLQYHYFDDGSTELLELYIFDKLQFSLDFNEDGTLVSEENYSYTYNQRETRNEVHSTTRDFYENGRLKSSHEIEDEESLNWKEYLRYYNQEGYIESECTLIEDEKNGICRNYYRTGKIKDEAIYKDDFPKGKKHFYNADGKIEKIEVWRNKKLVKTKYQNKT